MPSSATRSTPRAYGANTDPAAVMVTPRPSRATRVTPSSACREARAAETAGGLTKSMSAASDTDPQSTTARKVRS